MVHRSAKVLLALLIVIIGMTIIANQEGTFYFSNSQVVISSPSFIKLGYSPGNLFPTNVGVPVYSPGDSMWLVSTSNLVVAVQLLSPTGDLGHSQTISVSTVSLLYTFSAKDTEGNWTLKVIFENSSLISIRVPFVNPLQYPVYTSISNFSVKSGSLGVHYDVSTSDAYHMEACFGSFDVNSTLVIPIPESVGSGQVLINQNLLNATVSVNGETSQKFAFHYVMDYSYSFSGNLPGELVSKDITVISSSTTFFTSGTPESVSLTNNTFPRPGRYNLDAFFDTGNGPILEQTSALLLSNGMWVWIGGCNPTQVSSLSFTRYQSLTQGPRTWPNTLYLMYEINGVDAYSVQQFNFKVTSIHIEGSNPNATISFLHYSISPNRDILASNVYDDFLYMVLRAVPVTVNITPNFGGEIMQSQSIEIEKANSINQVVIPVGKLAVHVTNDSIPLEGASVIAENGFGGKVSATSGSDGNFAFYLPQGTYNVTASSAGLSLSKNVTVSTYSESSVQFDFVSGSTFGYATYLLISVLIVGFVLNVWLWLLRPKRNLY